MLTAEDYRQSIRDGRASYLEGRRIEDPVTHPLLRVSVDWVASTYEQTCAAEPGGPQPDLRPAGDARRARRADELPHRGGCHGSEHRRLHGVGQRGPAPGRGRPRLPRPARAVPPALSRRRPPRRRRGRGRWRAASGAPHQGRHRPAGRQAPRPRSGGGARAVRRAVGRGRRRRTPTGRSRARCRSTRPGLKIISITTAPRAEDPRHFPISREKSIPDCTVLFDEVFVPWDRVFLDGEVAYSAALADALGTWERARAAATLADEAELIYGLAQTIVEMNGVPDATHIRDKLSKMAVWASMCRAGWTAALAHAVTTESGDGRPRRRRTCTRRWPTAAASSTRWSRTCTTSPVRSC